MATPQTSPQHPQRSVADVLQDIVNNIQEIIHAEFRLATLEIKEKAGQASSPATTLVTGAIFGLYGGGFLLLAGVYALSMVVAPWLAALIVGAILSVVALVLVTTSRNKLRTIDPFPEKTVQSVKENVQWAKEQIK